MLQSIQGWERFYIQWIRQRKNIFVLYFDSFAGSSIKSGLKELMRFLNIEWDEHRLSFMQKCKEDKVRRKKTRYSPSHLNNQTSNKFIASSTNSCTPNELYSFDIYNDKQFIWMRSAIRRVKRELEKHGLHSSSLSNHKCRNLRVYICPDT